MRDILFRGKRVDNGEWVYGFYATGKDGYDEIVHYIYEPCGIFNRVGADTVGQYTGLTDKNGNRLYEKDIVNCKTRSYLFEGYTIEWYKDDARFVMVKNGRKYAVSEFFEYEIVGNITDNQDMLTDKGEG